MTNLDNLHPNDYRVITAKYAKMFNHVYPRKFGRNGTNFMTPTVLGYVKVGGEIVEISYGTGFNHDPIFGVTFESDDERDGCFFSLEEVAEHLGV